MHQIQKRKIHCFLYIFILFVIYLGCTPDQHNRHVGISEEAIVQRVSNLEVLEIIPGAERLATYVPRLQGKNVGLVVNQTSIIGDKHLLDSLLELDIRIGKIFAPEHGFRGEADAGEKVESGVDDRTGIPIISLYGSKRGPSAEDMEGLDILVYDIQDVGVRFYTYISTMHYIMQACADHGKPLIILDRPNPNGYYVDGPVLEPEFRSFVGMHPIPVVYGLTCGELAGMINGEGWLDGGKTCDLTVVSCLNYSHDQTYELPVKPSPNLPNLRSILLYPSLCYFEPTIVSIGRGTNKQFQVIGHPDFKEGSYVFRPAPGPGAMHPKLEGQDCYGVNLEGLDPAQIMQWEELNLGYLLGFYKSLGKKEFITNPDFFDKLAGTDKLRKQIESGLDEDAIRSSWAKDIAKYREKRRKYLLYEL